MMRKNFEGLTIIQIIELLILKARIGYAKKRGEKDLRVSYIDDNLIEKLEQNGYSILIQRFGCSAFATYFTVYIISWK